MLPSFRAQQREFLAPEVMARNANVASVAAWARTDRAFVMTRVNRSQSRFVERREGALSFQALGPRTVLYSWCRSRPWPRRSALLAAFICGRRADPCELGPNPAFNADPRRRAFGRAGWAG